MSFYKDLVMQTQMNFQKYYGIYRRGGTPCELAGPSKLSMDEKIDRLVQEIRDADCVIVGGASGLSTAGGGNFYYETTIPSRNTSASSRKSTTSTAPSTACSVTGMTVRLSGHSLRHSFIRRSLRPSARRTMIWTPCSRVRISSSSRRTRIRSSSNSIRKIKSQSCRATTVSSSAPPAARMTRGMPCSR